MILYLFISNLKNKKSYERIKNMMKLLDYYDYIIVYGNSRINEYNKDTKILKLNVNDSYEGLPEKVLKSFKYICNNDIFKKITYICKLDDDMIIKKLLVNKNLPYYLGNVYYRSGNRKWHIGKCSKNSKFNNNQYKGKYVPWCRGGYGYIVKKDKLYSIISDKNYTSEIYEDLYISKLLNKNKIYPTNVNLEEYLISPTHKI